MENLITKQRLEEIFAKADKDGFGNRKAEIVQSLINKGGIIEGLNQPKEDMIQKKGFFKTLVDVSSAPINYLTGVTEQGLGAVAKGVGNLTGSETLQNVGTRLQNQTSDAEQRQNLADTGTFARYALPVAAGIATAGASLPLTLGTSAAAGATGSVAQNVTDYEQESLGTIAKQAVTEGVVDSGIDLLTLGLGKALKPVTKKITAGLKSSAVDSIGKALNPTTNANKVITNRIAGEIINRPISEVGAITAGGLKNKAKAGRLLAGEAFEEIPALAGRVNTTDVLSSLQKMRSEFIIDGKIIDATPIKVIDDVSKTIAQYGTSIPNSTLQKIGRVFSKQVAKGGGYIGKSIKEGTEIDVKREVTDSIREILAKQFPDVAAINKEYTFWKNFENVAGATKTRKVGQKGAFKNLMTAIGASSGAAAGGPSGAVVTGGAFRTVASLIDSPIWNIVAAKTKDRLADAIASGSTKKIRLILKESSRLMNDQSDTKDSQL